MKKLVSKLIREPVRETAKGHVITNPPDASTPTDKKLSDGQYADHWVLSKEERSKQYVRPYRDTYKHVGKPGPEYDSELRDLTPEEIEESLRMTEEYRHVKYEKYAKERVRIYPHKGKTITTTSEGRYWSQAELDAVGLGCGEVTKMPAACAETYAVNPVYYGGTFCVGCNQYLGVGEWGEFIWLDDGTRVGT